MQLFRSSDWSVSDRRSQFNYDLTGWKVHEGQNLRTGLVIGVALGAEIGLAAVLELANRKKSS